MKLKKNSFFLAASAVCALLSCSCSLLHDSSRSESASSGPSTVRLQVSSIGERTALPAVDTTNITSFKLVGTPIGDLDTEWTDHYGNSYDAASGITWTKAKSGNTTLDTALENATATMLADEIGMAAGTWTFTLTAARTSTTGDSATYTSQITLKVGGGQNTANFDLALTSMALGTGTGTLTITVAFTEEVTSQLLTAKVYKVSGNVYDENDILTSKTTAGVTLTEGSGTWTAGDTADAPTEVTVATADETFAADSSVDFTVTDLAASEYYVVFTFYDTSDKTNVLATWREAAYLTSLGAESTISVSSLDSTSDIIYLKLLDEVPSDSDTTTVITAYPFDATDYASGVTNENQSTYSRHSSFTLANPAGAESDYTFWRWVEVNCTTGAANDDGTYSVTFNSAITEHVAGQIGPKYYMAQFFSAEAYKQIDHITLTDASASNVAVSGASVTQATAVGHTITATAYTAETESDDSTFKADVTWTWQTSADGTTWTTIGDTSGSSDTANSDISAVTSGIVARTSSLRIRPAYVGTYIRALAVQTYNVDTSGSTTVVTKNSGISDSTPSAVTASVVANGTLKLNNAVLTYSGTTVIGSALSVANFTLTGGTVCDSVATDWAYADTDSETDAPSTFSESLDEDDAVIALLSSTTVDSVTTTAVAPYSSGYTALPLTCKVSGYDDLVLEADWTGDSARPTSASGNVVFLTVQAKAPVLTRSASDTESEQLLVALMDKNLVTYNKIRFTTVSPTATTVTAADGCYPTAIVPALEYSFDATATTWQTWTTTEEPDGTSTTANYLVQEISAESESGVYSTVYVRTAATGTAGESGYVTASEAVSIDISSLTGTLVRLSGVTLSTPNVTRSTCDKADASVNDGYAKVGSTTTVSLTPEITGQSITVTALTYTWTITEADEAAVTVRSVTKAATDYADDTASFYTDSYQLASADASLVVYNGSASNDSTAGNAYTISDSTAGSTLSVTVTPVYQTATADSATLPEATRVSATAEAAENDKSAASTIAKGTLQFASGYSIAYKSGGEALTVISGTKPNLSYVVIRGMISDACSNTVVNDNTASLYGVNYTFDNTTTITGETTPLRFRATGFNDAIVNVTTSTLSAADTAVMLLSTDTTRIPLGSILFEESTDYKYYMFEYCTDYTAGSDSNAWYPVPSTPFSTNGTYYADTDDYFTSNVYFRFKATSTVGGHIYYYNRYDNVADKVAEWISVDGSDIPDTVNLASAAPSEAFEIALSDGTVNYIGGHCGVVTISIASDKDVELGMIGKNVVYVTNDSLFTYFTWYLDDTLVQEKSEDGVSFTVASSYVHTKSGTGKYILRVIAENEYGDEYTGTVTYVYTKQ